MKTIKILALLLIPLVLVACTFTVNAPAVTTGETQILEINEPIPEGDEIPTVKIEMGAGKLDLDGGTDQLIAGTITYNLETWVPVVTRENSTVKIAQKTTNKISIPEGQIKNQWDLRLGSVPMNLSLATGAYEGQLNLGGLAIASLTISDGASSSKVRFDEPNLTTMSNLKYSTGASDVELYGLGNAHVSEVDFTGGVGSYTLDFSGENSNDCEVTVKSGVSSVKIIIPENARAEVIINSELNDVNLKGTWTVENNRYFTGEEGALIRITIDMAVGDLEMIAN
jgi:hypothetical protein